jgi:hypothetical protein
VANSNSSNISKGALGIVLNVTGGSGTGSISYNITGSSCSFSPTTKILSVASSYRPGLVVTCSVIAKQSASGFYTSATSEAKSFNFR